MECHLTGIAHTLLLPRGASPPTKKNTSSRGERVRKIAGGYFPTRPFRNQCSRIRRVKFAGCWLAKKGQGKMRDKRTHQGGDFVLGRHGEELDCSEKTEAFDNTIPLCHADMSSPFPQPPKFGRRERRRLEEIIPPAKKMT